MPISRINNNESNSQQNQFEQKGEGNFRISKFYETIPLYKFSDIILSKEIEKDIQNFLTFANNQKKIFEDWNLKSVIKNYNLCINLYGPSGTGKTMMAHAIANSLNKKMIIVNYAEIESKYVGETSKNLIQLFKFAEEHKDIILFDEADALLSKRITLINSATDVSVNQTRNTLLKILDEYTGIVIFTTNFIQNLDSAFIRRIFSSIEFKLPNYDVRKLLWSHYLIDTLPINNKTELVNEVSKIEGLTGSDIATIVLKTVIELLEGKDELIEMDAVLKNIDIIKKTKCDFQQYEITSRKVSEDYVKEKLQIKEGK